ncbi:MAG TPA: phosphatase PAP2 family protein [Actinomycetes bacterium]
MLHKDRNPGTRSGLAVLAQVALVTSFVVLYFGVRGRTAGDADQARRNALRLVRWEQLLGFDVERAIQAPLRGSPALTTVVNWVYVWGHWPVIVATLWWLLARHPATFAVTRDALLLSGAVGMLVFALFPVMPPRLADLGLVDTVTQHSQSYRVLQPSAFVNPYAAMPSLHMGWDLLVGIALVVAARRWWVRALGILLPAAMAWAVVASANHYVLDAVVGAVLVLVCRRLASWRQTSGRARPVTTARRSRAAETAPSTAPAAAPAPAAGSSTAGVPHDASGVLAPAKSNTIVGVQAATDSRTQLPGRTAVRRSATACAAPRTPPITRPRR